VSRARRMCATSLCTRAALDPWSRGPLNCGVRRHVEGIVLCCLGASLTACSSMSAYTTTAAWLSDSDYTWAPMDKGDFYVPSEVERMRSSNDFARCMDELSERLLHTQELNSQLGVRKYVPTREQRVLDIVRCMGQKGWHLVAVEPIVVTSAA
jgi:hypothetical protein